MPNLNEQAHFEPDDELREIICIQNAFGKSAQSIAILHGLSVKVVERIIREGKPKGGKHKL